MLACEFDNDVKIFNVSVLHLVGFNMKLQYSPYPGVISNHAFLHNLSGEAEAFSIILSLMTYHRYLNEQGLIQAVFNLDALVLKDNFEDLHNSSQLIKVGVLKHSFNKVESTECISQHKISKEYGGRIVMYTAGAEIPFTFPFSNIEQANVIKRCLESYREYLFGRSVKLLNTKQTYFEALGTEGCWSRLTFENDEVLSA